MGLKTVTDGKAVTVYRKDRDTQNGGKFTTYSIGIASKDKDGNWVNGFLPCNFRKGTDIANKSKITISNSFPTVRKYTDKTGTERTEIGIFVLDYTVVEGGNAPQTNVADADFMQVSEDIEGLPFS